MQNSLFSGTSPVGQPAGLTAATPSARSGRRRGMICVQNCSLLFYAERTSAVWVRRHPRLVRPDQNANWRQRVVVKDDGDVGKHVVNESITLLSKPNRVQSEPRLKEKYRTCADTRSHPFITYTLCVARRESVSKRKTQARGRSFSKRWLKLHDKSGGLAGDERSSGGIVARWAAIETSECRPTGP